MSGIYNNWIKVNHQNLPNDMIPMMSGGFQTPFYFGGSQVPEIIGYEKTIQGQGMFKSTNRVPKILQGIKSQQTFNDKHSNILLPRLIQRK